MSETGVPDRVVVGVDGSEKDAPAVGWAADEAARRGAGLHLVCAFARSGPAIISPVPLPRASTWDDIEAIGRRITEAGAVRAREGHPDLVVTTQTSFEPAADALVRASEQASVLVVGARGLGRFAGRLLGSVSQKVVGNAYSPVVVVRPGGVPDGPVVAGVDATNIGAPEVLDFAFGSAARRGVAVRVVLASNRSGLPDDAAVDGLIDDSPDQLLSQVHAHVRTCSATYPGVPVQVTAVKGHPVEVLTEEARAGSLLVVGNRGRGGLVGLLGSVAYGVLHEAPVVAVVKVR